MPQIRQIPLQNYVFLEKIRDFSVTSTDITRVSVSVKARERCHKKHIVFVTRYGRPILSTALHLCYKT